MQAATLDASDGPHGKTLDKASQSKAKTSFPQRKALSAVQ